MNKILPCGCIPDASGYGYCSKCTKELRAKIWADMDEDRKNYDRHFAPKESAYLDSPGCSCHINPPCDYCIENLGEEDE